MPWTPEDAEGFTGKANTRKKKRRWAHVANSVLAETDDEGKAVRAANAAVAGMTGDRRPEGSFTDPIYVRGERLRRPGRRLRYSDPDDEDEFDDSLRNMSLRRAREEPELTKEEAERLQRKGDSMPAKQIQFHDTVELDDAAKVRVLDGGYIAAMPRIARTGIQIYHGSECGRPDMETVRVYRPEDSVFHTDAVRSLTHLPLTLEHPPEPVTADNWKKYAVGDTGDEVLRDGNSIRVPMMMRDAAAIKAFKDGKNQLSVGYVCDVEWGEGRTPDGETYDAIQRNIKANHLAVVAAARGGSSLKIGDGTDPHQQGAIPMALRQMTVDGLSVQLEDRDAQIVQKALDTLNTKVKDAEGKAAKAEEDKEEWKKKFEKDSAEKTAVIATKDAEIATLKTQLKDAEMTPQKLDALVTDRANAVGKAQTLLGPTFKADGKTVGEVRRMVVDAKLGDQAKGWTDEMVTASFNTLAASIKPAGGNGMQDAVHAFSGTPINDAKEQAYNDYDKQSSEAWRGQTKQ